MKKKNKKILLPVMAAVLSMAMLFTGCGGSQEKTKTENSSEKKEKKNEYKKLEGVYKSEISVEDGMSTTLYLQINKKGEFVFAGDTDFTNKEKGAGHLEKNKDKKDTFVYTEIEKEKVKEGEKVSEFKVTEEGGIQFLSTMWFGSTTPKIAAEDEVTYPLFTVYDEEAEKAETEETEEAEDVEAEEGSTEAEPGTSTESTDNAAPSGSSQGGSSTPAPQPVPQPVPQPEPQVPASNFQEGTYYGTFGKYVDAMESNIHYDITLRVSGGTYSYTVGITVSGKLSHSGSESYSGSYTVNGNQLSMTGKLKSANAGAGGDLTVTGILSSFASSNETVTLYR